MSNKPESLILRQLTEVAVLCASSEVSACCVIRKLLKGRDHKEFAEFAKEADNQEAEN